MAAAARRARARVVSGRDPGAPSVGSPYGEGRSSRPGGPRLTWGASGFCLRLLLDSPTASEAGAVREGAFAVGLIADEPDCAVLVYRARLPGAGRGPRSGIPWSGVALHRHLIPVDRRASADPIARVGGRMRASVRLVDASSGLVAALRSGTLGPSFTEAWVGAMRAQAARGFEPGRYRAARERLVRRYPSARQAARASIRSQIGP